MNPDRPYIIGNTHSLGPLRAYLNKRQYNLAYEVERRNVNGHRMIGLSYGARRSDAEKRGLVVVCDDSLFPETMAIIERKVTA